MSREWTHAQVVEMHRRYIEDAATYRDLGEEEGVSHERIRQLFHEHGLATDKPRRSTRIKRDHELEAFQRREEIAEVYRRVGNLEVAARELGLPVRYIKPHIPETDRLFYRHQGTVPTYTRDEIANFLRCAAEVCGEPLTLPKYNAVAREMGLPAQTTVTRPWDGNWQAACDYAGVAHNPPRGRRRDSLTQDDCIRALRLYYADNNDQVPSYNNYNAWARANGQLSGGTIRAKFNSPETNTGGWRNALRAAFPNLYDTIGAETA